MFAYPGCEDWRSVDLELCLSIDSMNGLGNNQDFMTALLSKSQFWSKNEQFRP